MEEVEAAVFVGVMAVKDGEEKAISKGSPPYSMMFRAVTTIEEVNRRLRVISGEDEA